MREERLKDHYVVIERAIGHWKNIGQDTVALKAKGGSDKRLEKSIKNNTNDLLNELTVTGVEDALIAIHDELVGKHGKSLPQLCFEKSYGDIRAVSVVTAKLTKYAENAAMCLTVISALRDGEPVVDAEQASEAADREYRLTARLQRMNDACQKICKSCLNLDTLVVETDRFVTDNLDDWNLSMSNTRGAAHACVTALADQWPAWNFTAIVYPALPGRDHSSWHAGIGRRGTIKRTRTQDLDEKDHARLLIYYAARGRSKKVTPKMTSQVSEHDPQTTFTAFSRMISGFVTELDGRKTEVLSPLSKYIELWPLFQQFHPKEMAEKFLELVMRRSDPKVDRSWHGAMIWAGRMLDEWQILHHNYPEGDDGLSKFMAICTQNETEIYRPKWVRRYAGYGNSEYVEDEGPFDPDAPTKIADLTHTRNGTITYNGVCTVLVRPDVILTQDEWDAARKGLADALKKVREREGKIDPPDWPDLGLDTLHPGHPGPF